MKVLNQEISTNWAVYNGDCVEVMKGFPENSIGYSIFSPPFSTLYTYSNSLNDMGNSKNYDEFSKHFKFFCENLFRIIQEGRNVSVHCMNLQKTIQKDNSRGLIDFRGDIIRLFESVGFIYHSEVMIWKDPLIQAVRTKTQGLLHNQLCKDSSLSQQGLPDYVVTFKKPGTNLKPIAHPNGFNDCEYPGDNLDGFEEGNKSHTFWRKLASPVWFDIRQGNTLNFRHAKGQNDERHISPLQLDVIERCLLLWSKEKDIVLSPFAGIGSEIYQSVKMGRKAIGIELKESYYKESVKIMKELEYESETSLEKFFI